MGSSPTSGGRLRRNVLCPECYTCSSRFPCWSSIATPRHQADPVFKNTACWPIDSESTQQLVPQTKSDSSPIAVRPIVCLFPAGVLQPPRFFRLQHHNQLRKKRLQNCSSSEHLRSIHQSLSVVYWLEEVQSVLLANMCKEKRNATS